MKQIVVTGAAGFIGSNMVQRLNSQELSNIIIVDRFDDNPAKQKNVTGLNYTKKIDRDVFIEWFTENADEVEFVFHLGARTDTAEFNFRVLDSLNLSYSKSLWEICTVKQIPLLYASSAATYGIGDKGFNDNHALIPDLKPLNAYGLSKQLFDMYVLEQTHTPPFWCGLKFFNVYGPYEAHKGRMASVIYHAYHQIVQTGNVKLFKSHVPEYKDGEQLRDFIHVDDVVEVCMHFYEKAMTDTPPPAEISAIYNLGTGTARTFNDLVTAIFNALNLPVNIEYIPIPEDIRDKYQYYTQAEMKKLKSAGYPLKFKNLDDGIRNYVYFLKKT